MSEWDDDVWDRADQAINALEQSLVTPRGVAIEDLLPPIGDPQRQTILVSLIQIDQEHRWDCGDRPTLEDYLHDWQELAGDHEAISTLLANECAIRAAHDTLPTPTEIEARFPNLLPAIDLQEIAREQEYPGSAPLEDSPQISLLESITSERQERQNRGRSDTLPLGTRLGRYRVVAALGQGGMGTVYLAEDEELDRTVAVKVLHPWAASITEADTCLLEEARTAAKLKHPAIVPVHDVGKRDDGTPFFVMEYVDGRSLAELIASDELDIRKAVGLAIQLAEALHAAHQGGIIHRDIKPANVLVDSEGRAHITDFGLAIKRSDASLRDGEFSGTLPYMAPEQIRGKVHQINERTDIWALGVVLYEMLTSRRPFPQTTHDEIAQAVVESEPVPPREINRRLPRGIQRLCLKCLSKDPSDRFASAGDVAKKLRRERPFIQLSSRLRRRHFVALAAILATVALSGAVASLEKKRRDLEERPVVDWLSECQLVLNANTGATIDLDAAHDMVDVHRANMLADVLQKPLLVPDASRHDDVKVMVTDRWLRFEIPLKISLRKNVEDASLVPRHCALKLRVAVSHDGHFQLGTIGDVPEEHLLALAFSAGLDNYSPFSGRSLESGLFKTPHDCVVDLDDRQNLLASWYSSIYGKLHTAELVRGGPRNGAELYARPVRLRNLFSRPITVVQAYLYHQRFDYDHFGSHYQRIDECANSVWSPSARKAICDPDLSFSFDMYCQHEASSAMVFYAGTDGDRPGSPNSSMVRVSGIDVDQESLYLEQGIPRPGMCGYASITSDGSKRVCQASNQEVSVAEVVLYGQAPTQVRLEAQSRYSSVTPYFRYATLGSVEILGTQWSPKGLAKRKIKPQEWVILPEGKETSVAAVHQ